MVVEKVYSIGKERLTDLLKFVYDAGWKAREERVVELENPASKIKEKEEFINKILKIIN